MFEFLKGLLNGDFDIKEPLAVADRCGEGVRLDGFPGDGVLRGEDWTLIRGLLSRAVPVCFGGES